MRIIKAQSVSAAFATGAQHLFVFGTLETSRNGPVLVSPVPVITVFERPERRVMVNAERDANPFFHLFESLWMLAGRNDLAFPQMFISNFDKYSDDGETLHGAYGYRWRHAFGFDQLLAVAATLREDPNSRRAVLQMWDATATGMGDLHKASEGGKDVPCNTTIFFDTLGGMLNMTVTCRSNDMVYGAYGANAVHFSILLEWMSAATGIPMGAYRQVSNNFHAYMELYGGAEGGGAGLAQLGAYVLTTDIYGQPGPLTSRDYTAGGLATAPIIQPFENAEDFLSDCELFCKQVTAGAVWLDDANYETVFFDGTVLPMFHTWKQWKSKRFAQAEEESRSIVADDWRKAATDWLNVRTQKRNRKENIDG